MRIVMSYSFFNSERFLFLLYFFSFGLIGFFALKSFNRFFNLFNIGFVFCVKVVM